MFGEGYAGNWSGNLCRKESSVLIKLNGVFFCYSLFSPSPTCCKNLWQFTFLSSATLNLLLRMAAKIKLRPLVLCKNIFYPVLCLLL